MTERSNNFAKWVNQQVESHSSAVLSDSLRASSLSRLVEGSFPTRRDEEWKYTPLNELLETLPERNPDQALDTELLENLKTAVPEALTLVFLNGELNEALSDTVHPGNPDSVRISRLSDLDQTELGKAEQLILDSTLSDDNIFQHIALGLSQNGLLIDLEKNTEVARPIHVLRLSSGSGKPNYTDPVTLINLGSNSRLSIVEQFVSLGDSEAVTVPATYININDGAGLDHYRVGLENEATYHICNTAVTVSGSGTYRSHQYLLGSKLTRSNLEVKFSKPAGHAVLRGVYLGDDDQHLDVRTYLDHAQPHCSSDQHFRGILNGQSRGVFNGLVLVREQAQQTDAQQSNKNLLLSRDARVDTKPQLEIFADDVKCAHGATVGQLDEAALFYLQSRGIGAKDATLMLTRAFAAEVTQEIEIDTLQEYVQNKVSAALDEIVTLDD